MNRETILCAAIWYREIEKYFPQYELYKKFLPVNCDKGVVFTGHRHAHCMYLMCAITGKRSVVTDCGEYVQGFLTNKNRFVDRQEGAEIALDAGQLIREIKVENLFSEDLY